ncbi:hypothetical protein CKY01_22195 [Photorhabdus laumondii subsp. clarkei]|uniref:Uncharacterized protein n=1 Tax=Photorhabdus laumondii subsp. clarkei TaxID=2029685 RepID=A0A329VAH3_9GAMM|nr:hypothetical protein CKY01_22195 [Photorhabdus laumondii subsp. clarkei]
MPLMSGSFYKQILFYKLTLIKKEQKDFTTTEIISTIKKQQMIYPLFDESRNIISRLNNFS